MATTKLGSSKSAAGSIRYAEERAVEESGVNCIPEYAISSFKAVRELYNKPDGVQAHTIIQSFKPGEITPKKANEVGREFAERLVEDKYQVAIYTHADKEHIHNHIIINAVGLTDKGRKYQSNAKQRHLVKDLNDEICVSHGLSVPEKHTNAVSYTLSEQELAKKEKTSWKDELRVAIEQVGEHATSFEDFQNTLKEDYDIEFKMRGNTISYRHPERKKWVRAKKLGAKYDKGELTNGFERHHRRQEIERREEEYRQLTEQLEADAIAERERKRQREIDEYRKQLEQSERDWDFEDLDGELEL